MKELLTESVDFLATVRPIKEKKLYLYEHETWGAFCRAELRLTPQHVNRLIAGRSNPVRGYKGPQKNPTIIYFIEACGADCVKIGITNTTVSCRIASLQTGCPFPLKQIGSRPGTRQQEFNIHRQFSEHHIHGEWFRLTPEIQQFITAI